MAFWALAGAASANGLTYLVHEPVGKAGPPPLIVLLHGAGADERDMIGLWSQLPRTFVVISPRAPFADRAGGYRWYRKEANGRSGVVEADIATSRKIIDDVVDDALHRFGADPRRIFLAGFSQGAVMVYAVALVEPGRLRGAAVLSGSLLSSAGATPTATADRHQTRFFVGHGTADRRIPFAAAVRARAELARIGVPTAFHAYPGMGHAVGSAETADLSAWLSDQSTTPPPP